MTRDNSMPPSVSRLAAQVIILRELLEVRSNAAWVARGACPPQVHKVSKERYAETLHELCARAEWDSEPILSKLKKGVAPWE